MRLTHLAAALALFAASGLSLGAQQTVVWAPKPTQLPAYSGPLKPHIKLADLKDKVYCWIAIDLQDNARLNKCAESRQARLQAIWT